VNEELALESSLNLTLTQHPHDEDLEPQEVHAHLEVNPLKFGIIAFLRTFAPW
jgi:hypothetical protein